MKDMRSRMMFRFLAVLVFLSIIVPEIEASCSMANWWSTFDRPGYSTCSSYSQYLNGLMRNSPNEGDDIYLIEEGRCCTRTAPYQNQPTTCVPGDWVYSFDKNNRWSLCPRGYFLRGLCRSDGNGLHSIEYGQCCKPANHPYYWGSCYDQDVILSFDKEGTSKCNEGYFMVGMYRGTCDKLHCIEKFRCCQMFSDPPVVQSLANVKTRVMDTTLRSIAYLAYYLGYGWCAGCRGQDVGDDFTRNRDSWEAVTGHSLFPCNGHKADQRLKIHYRDFGFAIKDIQYGKAVIQTLTPQVYDSGKVKNTHSTSTKTTVERTVQSVRTVTHTTTSSWKKSHELGVEITYTPPDFTGGFGGKASYKFSYENSQSTTDSTSRQQSKSFKIVSEKTLEPYSSAEWQIMLSKTRSTVPYTATVVAKFSAELDGFLRWGNGYDSKTTNYHQSYRGSDRRPTFKYKFGDSSTPFYEALRRQSSQGRAPWMWSDMLNNWSPNAQNVINDLTNEGWYEFKLTGQFEDVVGQHADIQWRDSSSKRSVLLPKREKKDPPRVFPSPPEVNIHKGVYRETSEIPVNSTMS